MDLEGKRSGASSDGGSARGPSSDSRSAPGKRAPGSAPFSDERSGTPDRGRRPISPTQPFDEGPDTELIPASDAAPKPRATPEEASGLRAAPDGRR
eukprot:12153366-Alexandrium_andersonii.AAC.1